MTVHYYREFDRLDEAQEFRRRELINYPREGYCTNLRVYQKDDKFVVSGHRSSSCD